MVHAGLATEHAPRVATRSTTGVIAMRVLHLSPGKLYGGVERLLSTLAAEAWRCPEMSPEFGVCYDDRLARELRAHGAPVHVLGTVRLSRPWTVWTARDRLRRVMTATCPDAVICHAYWPHVVFAPVVKHLGTPLVFWAHDLHRGVHVLERWAARTPPSACIANSDFTLSTLGRLFRASKRAVVYCPVAPPPRPDPARRAAIRHEMETPESDVVIVIASRLERWKGHATLIGALARLAHRPGWTCWIVGGPQRPHEGRLLAELRPLARARGIERRVRFAGQRADVHAVLDAADIHCQPNIGPEPFGLAFVEALHAQLPVVSCAHGAVLEIVDRDTGVLVTPGDEAALAYALERLIADPAERPRLGGNGPVRAAQLCDATRQLGRLSAVLRRAAEGA